MKRKLIDNIPLKIMSLIVGFLVWLIVANIDNPVVTVPFTVQTVDIINEAYIEETGKTYLRDENQGAIRVYITGERKTVGRLSLDDIKAVADLQQAVSLETDPVMVPITVTCQRIPSSNIKVSPQNLTIHLEDKVTSEFAVNVTSGESKPDKSYEIGSYTALPEKVRITGPESLVKKIDKVSVTVNVEGLKEDTTEEARLRIIDKNQEELTESMMNSLEIDNNGIVFVTTRLWKVQTDVKLEAGYTGTPQEGYTVGEVTTVPDTISITGSDEALENLKKDGNTVWVPENLVDISEKSRDIEKKINLTDILPEGLRLTSGSSEDAWVRISILPEGGSPYSLPTNEIQVKNKTDDMQVSFMVAEFEVRVQSESGSMDDFDPENIVASIDLKGKEEGSYVIPVSISLPDGYELIDEVTTEVKITKISSVEESKE